MKGRDLLVGDPKVAIPHQDYRQAQCGLSDVPDAVELGPANGFAHTHSSSSLVGSSTIAEAGEATSLPRGSSDDVSRFRDTEAVRGVDPVDGWELRKYLGDDTDGFRRPEYIARGSRCDVHLDVSRFSFEPTQDRFAWLVRTGFPECPDTGPWDDHDIDERIAREQMRAAA